MRSVWSTCTTIVEIRPNLQPRVLLVGCVSQKTDRPAPARDLYTSDLFHKRRAYAEASGRAWFILSAKHGLVQPDTTLAPYDETLTHLSQAALSKWGERTVSQLELVLGPLKGRVLEIHAGKRYVEGVGALLLFRGASVEVPLKGLRIGEQLQWYLLMTREKAK